MLPNKSFQIALVISLCAHGVILSQSPNLPVFFPGHARRKAEIRYVKPLPNKQNPPKAVFTQPKFTQAASLHKIPLPGSVNARPRQLENQKIVAQMREPVMFKPAVAKPDIISVKKKITLPPVDLDKINNPSYVSYYQIVREKIRRCAYQNYARTEQGEVYLSFVISNDGYVKEIRVVEEKSSTNAYLIETSVRSVRGAAPFPDFPKELDYQQLSFNVVISYEVGE